MKVYEKPALTLLTVSASDALCLNGCMPGYKWTYDQYLAYLEGLGFTGNPNDAFSSGDSCASQLPGFEFYCKFTGANQIFTS